jgi:hypothetical protein
MLTAVLYNFPQSLPDKFRDKPLIMAPSFPFISFPIHRSLIILDRYNKTISVTINM